MLLNSMRTIHHYCKYLTLNVCFVQKTPLGTWEFRSKSKQDISSLEGGCKGYMFALEVTEELETWPEQGNRDRKWVSMLNKTHTEFV